MSWSAAATVITDALYYTLRRMMQLASVRNLAVCVRS